jgi:hypothetical protein
MAQRISKAQEQAFLLALAFGATVENAARKAGVSERSAYRRLEDPAFRARRDQLRFDTVLRISGMLTGGGLGSVKSLVDLRDDASVTPAVRRRAARDVLELGVTYRDAAGLEQRVAALEDQRANAR